MRIKRLAALAVVSTGMLVATALPASAGPVAGVFVGTATTGGIWAPVAACGGSLPAGLKLFCPSGTVAWWFGSNIADAGVVHGAVVTGTGNVSGAGTLQGHCGHSIGQGQAGVFGHGARVTWVSAGTTIVLASSTVTTPGHTQIKAVVNARAAAGTGNCVTAPATAFEVAGVVVIV